MDDVKDLVNNIVSGENNKATEAFKDIVGDKLKAGLDNRRQELAKNYANDAEDS